MKILWVTYAPVGRAATVFYNRTTQSGGWVDATLAQLKSYMDSGDAEVHIAALGPEKRTTFDETTGATYHMLPMSALRAKRDPAAVQIWKDFIAELKPDMIQVWGTEFTVGLDVLDAAGEIPVCFFIQGVMSSLVAHPLGDVQEKELRRLVGPAALGKFWSLRKWRKIDSKQVPYEAEMVSRAAGLLVDSHWTRAQYSAYTDKFYGVPLAANDLFRAYRWEADKCEKHALFTVAGGADPQKGVHNAVLAVAQLKEKYPDIRLYIPGSIASKKPHFLYDSVYLRHLRKLIAQYGLQENVVFVGKLSPEEMARHMCKANVFVMPSCVENHSSTLREAMTVGCPSVSAMIGSVPELIEPGKNGYLYRYNEFQTLAYYIDKLFSDTALAQEIGKNGKVGVTEKFPQEKIGSMLMDAYRRMRNEQ